MPSFQDNKIPYGSRKVDIYRLAAGTTGAGTKVMTLILENITVNRPTFIVKRYNELRAPNGAFGLEDYVEGSAVAQLPTDPTTVTKSSVQAGDLFTTTLDVDIGAETFIMHSPDHSESQGEYKKQPVKFIKQVGGGGANYSVF